MTKFVQVFTTVAKKTDGEKIAKALINKKFAACVQIVGPITSLYRWKNKTEQSKEFLCIIKAKSSYYRKIEKIIKENHSYELPEVIAVPIIEGSREYLEWIGKEL